MPLITDFVADRALPDLYETYLVEGLFAPWAEVLIDTVQPAGQCLDIACGTGIVSRKLSDLSQVTGVKAIDVAPPMIDKAVALQKEKDWAAKVDFQVASALELPFEENSFDGIFCQQGLQFFPDKPAALRESARVLKPNGAMIFGVWTSAHDGNPVFGAFENIVAEHLGQDLVPFGPFSFGNEGSLRNVAEEAGVRIERLERHELIASLPDVRTLVLFDMLFLGRPAPDGSLQPVIDPKDPDGDAIIEQIIDQLSQETDSYLGTDGSLKAPTTAHIMVARKI
jgi:ubiquinone/menaquinone biosynthesis C-methylase UbiE